MSRDVSDVTRYKLMQLFNPKRSLLLETSQSLILTSFLTSPDDPITLKSISAMLRSIPIAPYHAPSHITSLIARFDRS